MESRATTLAVTFGLLLVLASWVVVVLVLLVDFAPGTNDLTITTEPVDQALAGVEEPDQNAGDPTLSPTPTDPAGEGDGGDGGEGDPEGTEAVTTGDPSAEKPATTPEPEVPASIVHRIEPGDTLSAIGSKYGVDWREIASINNIADPDLIAAGRILQIPNPDAVATVTIGEVEPDVRADLEPLFVEWAEPTGVPVELLKAVAWQESRWDPSMVGPQGEIGIGQLLPEIHRFVETDLAERDLDPAVGPDSVEAMARYLGWLLDETQGDTSATLASYHQGLVSQRNIGWDDATIEYIATVVGIRPEFVDRAAG